MVRAGFGVGWGYFWGRLDFGGGTFPTHIGSQGALRHYPRGRSPLCFPTFPKFVSDLPQICARPSPRSPLPSPRLHHLPQNRPGPSPRLPLPSSMTPTAFPDHPLPSLAVLSLPLPPNGFPYSLSRKAENPGKLVDRRFPSMPYI